MAAYFLLFLLVKFAFFNFEGMNFSFTLKRKHIINLLDLTESGWVIFSRPQMLPQNSFRNPLEVIWMVIPKPRGIGFWKLQKLSRPLAYRNTVMWQPAAFKNCFVIGQRLSVKSEESVGIFIEAVSKLIFKCLWKYEKNLKTASSPTEKELI